MRIRLRDEIRHRCSLAAPSRIWKGSSSPSRCLLQPDGESHETHFRRLRRWCSNSATVSSLGGLRYSADDNGACGRRRAEHQNEAGGQRFSESGLTAARVHLMAMGLIIITSGCLPSRRTIFGQSPMRPALTLSERRASMRSRKRSSSVGMSDSAGRTPGPEGKERRR
jgi:hypothetical protein